MCRSTVESSQSSVLKSVGSLNLLRFHDSLGLPAYPFDSRMWQRCLFCCSLLSVWQDVGRCMSLCGVMSTEKCSLQWQQETNVRCFGCVYMRQFWSIILPHAFCFIRTSPRSALSQPKSLAVGACCAMAAPGKLGIYCEKLPICEFGEILPRISHKWRTKLCPSNLCWSWNVVQLFDQWPDRSN